MVAKAWLLTGVLVASATACRQNPECFGFDECAAGFICSDGTCVDPNLLDVNWQDDVLPIVTAKCLQCHGTVLQPGVPISLAEYANTQATAPQSGVPVYRAMAVRVQDPDRPMPPMSGSAEPLTESEIAVIVAWADQGAPFGPTAPACDGGSCAVDAGPSPFEGTAPPATLGTGYTGLNGPAWNAAARIGYVAHFGANQILTLNPPMQPQAGLDVAGGPRGLAVTAAGILIIAFAEAGLVARVDPTDPVVIPLAESFEGIELNGPEDVAVRSDGTIYFTDPGLGVTGERTLDFNGVFRIAAGTGLVTLEIQAPPTTIPNGLVLNADEDTLYISDASEDRTILSVPVTDTGALGNEVFFARTLGDAPAGMAIDTEGNLYVGSSRGVEVFSPAGRRLDVVALDQAPTNLGFMGEPRNVLVVTTQSDVRAIQMNVTGAR